jgi:hypothetical protein
LPSSSNHPDIQSLIAGGHWQEATMLARRIGIEALAQQKYAVARNTGRLLIRLRDYRYGSELMSVAMRELAPPCPLPEWDGFDMPNGTLLVISRNQHVGAVLRLARLLPLAAERAKHCIALVEPRLVPLFHRSFPRVDVREAGQADTEAYEAADVIASYETLARYLGVKDDGRVTELPTFQPDRDRVADFRRKYHSGKMLVGICWHSTNEKKDLPSLKDWSAYLSRVEATYVSIQYGDRRDDLAKLRSWSGHKIIHDETVDSLTNLDTFAAQIAALDAIVTISNTGAHMAGALNIPMFVVLDNVDQLLWPFIGRDCDWYPSTSLYQKENRPWSDIFAELETDFRARFAIERNSYWRQKLRNFAAHLLPRQHQE